MLQLLLLLFIIIIIIIQFNHIFIRKFILL